MSGVGWYGSKQDIPRGDGSGAKRLSPRVSPPDADKMCASSLSGCVATDRRCFPWSALRCFDFYPDANLHGIASNSP